jgi:hypothetical protein
MDLLDGIMPEGIVKTNNAKLTPTPDFMLSINEFSCVGGVTEWPMVTVLKTVVPLRNRGFESHPLRHKYP